MDTTQKKAKIDEVRAKLESDLARLEDVNIEELSDDDLEDVAGGCSTWCCSHDAELQ